jgi:type I restriction enzyme M protein
VYRVYSSGDRPGDIAGFCKVAPIEEVRGHDYALTPGRYVGAEDGPDDDEPFEEKFPRLLKEIEEQFARAAEATEAIRAIVRKIADGQ